MEGAPLDHSPYFYTRLGYKDKDGVQHDEDGVQHEDKGGRWRWVWHPDEDGHTAAEDGGQPAVEDEQSMEGGENEQPAEEPPAEEQPPAEDEQPPAEEEPPAEEPPEEENVQPPEEQAAEEDKQKNIVQEFLEIANVRTASKLKDLLQRFRDYQDGQKKALEEARKLKIAFAKKRKHEIEVEKHEKKIAKIEDRQEKFVNAAIATRRQFIDQPGYGDVEVSSSAKMGSKTARRRAKKKHSISEVAQAFEFKTPEK